MLLNYGAVIQRAMYSPDLPGYQYSTYSHTIRPGNVVAGTAKWNDWDPAPPHVHPHTTGTPSLPKKNYAKNITVRDASGKVLTERDPGFLALYRKELIRDNLKGKIDADGDHIMDFADDEDPDTVMGGLSVPKKQPKPGAIRDTKKKGPREKADVKMKGPMEPDPIPDVEMEGAPGPSKSKKGKGLPNTVGGVAAMDNRQRSNQVVVNRVKPAVAKDVWPAVGPIARPKGKLQPNPEIATDFPKIETALRRNSAPSTLTGGALAKPAVKHKHKHKHNPTAPKRFGKSQRNRDKDIQNARVAPPILAPTVVPVPRPSQGFPQHIPHPVPPAVRKPAGARSRAVYSPHTMATKRKSTVQRGGARKHTRTATDKNGRKRGDPFNPHATSKKARK